MPVWSIWWRQDKKSNIIVQSTIVLARFKNFSHCHCCWKFESFIIWVLLVIMKFLNCLLEGMRGHLVGVCVCVCGSHMIGTKMEKSHKIFFFFWWSRISNGFLMDHFLIECWMVVLVLRYDPYSHHYHHKHKTNSIELVFWKIGKNFQKIYPTGFILSCTQ